MFLAEYYEPDARPSAAARIAERAQDAAGELVREGADLRFVRVTLVPAEETCFLLYDAASADLVVQAVRRAAIRGARVTEAQESR